MRGDRGGGGRDEILHPDWELVTWQQIDEEVQELEALIVKHERWVTKRQHRLDEETGEMEVR
jgi:hypothetical protein